MLRAERDLARQALSARPVQPWLWIAPRPVGPLTLDGRGIRLSLRRGGGFGGDLRCGLPLPLPSESMQVIVVQHALDDAGGALLDECARVLAPGGRLWLFALNPYSPYRVRWARRLPAGIGGEAWRARARRAGLHCPVDALRYLGPVLRARGGERADHRPWRAVCALEAEKRTVAPVGPVAAKVGWQRPVPTL